MVSLEEYLAVAYYGMDEERRRDGMREAIAILIDNGQYREIIDRVANERSPIQTHDLMDSVELAAIKSKELAAGEGKVEKLLGMSKDEILSEALRDTCIITAIGVCTDTGDYKTLLKMKIDQSLKPDLRETAGRALDLVVSAEIEICEDPENPDPQGLVEIVATEGLESEQRVEALNKALVMCRKEDRPATYGALLALTRIKLPQEMVGIENVPTQIDALLREKTARLVQKPGYNERTTDELSRPRSKPVEAGVDGSRAPSARRSRSR
ncbi:hypothetical protein HZC07_05215 [Candidatus Micrarchaeota archaeon]|nr:hypothetical protein [Candidatus Micrarchaeota archaeon]